MKLFGIEVRRVRKAPPEVDPVEEMKAACDALNGAWERERLAGGKTRPWVEWSEGRVKLKRYSGTLEEVYAG